jgi:alpha-ribazole phosphatase
MKLYLVRHTSVAVPAGWAYGQTDVAVAPTFEEEAKTVKQDLKGLTFDKVWCSPLSRCVKLATFCGYPDATRDDRIKEISFGDWEMTSWEDLSADPRSKAWFDDWVNVPAPNGESLQQQYDRVSRFLDEVKAQGLQQACVFAHGGVLACARVYAGLVTLDHAFREVPVFGSVIKIEI